MIKRIILLFISILILMPAAAAAKGFESVELQLASKPDIGWKKIGNRTGYDKGGSKKDTTGDIYTLIDKGVAAVLSMVAIIFFGVTMYGGLRWLTSQGEDEKIQKAKNALKAGIIGMIIISLSYALTAFIFDKVTKSGSDSGGSSPASDESTDIPGSDSGNKPHPGPI